MVEWRRCPTSKQKPSGGTTQGKTNQGMYHADDDESENPDAEKKQNKPSFKRIQSVKKFKAKKDLYHGDDEVKQTVVKKAPRTHKYTEMTHDSLTADVCMFSRETIFGGN
jgi:hypothetical protein